MEVGREDEMRELYWEREGEKDGVGEFVFVKGKKELRVFI